MKTNDLMTSGHWLHNEQPQLRRRCVIAVRLAGREYQIQNAPHDVVAGE